MKVLIVTVLTLMLASTAFAAETGTTLWHSHSYVDSDSYVDRYSEFEKKQKAELGVGIDAIIYEFDENISSWGMDNISTEYKYDIANDNHSVYGVVHVNLWQMGKKLTGK